MKLKHVEIFHAVMLTGTLSSAARLLHVTQPAASQSLQLAELQLGYALFTRQKNRLVATAEAQALYPEVQKLVAQLEAVRRLAVAQRGGTSRPLRVLLVPSLATVLLPPALRLFRERHAAVALSIRTQHSHDIARAVALKEADVGIVYGHQPPPGLEAQPIASGRLVVVSLEDPDGAGAGTDPGPVRDRRRDGAVTLAEVVRRPFVRIDERDPLGALLAEQCAHAGLQPTGEIVVQTHHLALVLAEQGFGPAVIDSFTAAGGRDPRLRVRPIVPEVPVGVQALLSPGVRSPRTLAAFVAAIKAAADAHPAAPGRPAGHQPR